MRIWYLWLLSLGIMSAFSSEALAQDDWLKDEWLLTKPHQYPDVLIGEFEDCASKLGKQNLSDDIKVEAIQNIAVFIYQRQALDQRRVDLLERYRDDLDLMQRKESLKSEVAILLMWMNKQSGKIDNELAKQFAGISSDRFRRMYRFAELLELKGYESFQLVMAVRRLSGYDDEVPMSRRERVALAVVEAEMRKLELEMRQLGLEMRQLGLEMREEVPKQDRGEVAPLWKAYGWYDSGDRMRRDPSLEPPIDFKVELSAMLDATQPIQLRKKNLAAIIWEICNRSELEQEKIDLLVDSREQLVSIYNDPQAEMELRGMLAALVLWSNDRSKTDCQACVEALKSLNQSELQVVMMYAPMLHLQNSEDFRQMIAERFMDCDQETAQMILDILEMYAGAGDLNFATTIDLIAKLKDRSQVSALQFKQLLTILIDVNAKEASKNLSLEESIKERKANEGEKGSNLEGLELERKELDLWLEEAEKELKEYRRSRLRLPR